MKDESSLDDVLDCIERAFGRNGVLARTFLNALRAKLIDPARQTLNDLTFVKLISHKNPYLYRASGVKTITELVDRTLGDFMTSSIETNFGNFLELLALSLPGNIKSSAAGVDVERRSGTTTELYAVKSGPSGYNSSSWKTQREQLSAARARLQQAGHNVLAYTGPAYGRRKTTLDKKSGTIRLSSKELWQRLSGDEDFYEKLLEACACVSHLYEADFEAARRRLLNEALIAFADENGQVDWQKFLTATSG